MILHKIYNKDIYNIYNKNQYKQKSQITFKLRVVLKFYTATQM